MTVLMLGLHVELGRYRAEFLRSHSIDVIFPESKVAAVEAIRAGGFDIVLVSYSLSDDTVKELLEMVDQVCPACPVIRISNQRWPDRQLEPDTTVLATDPPEALLAAIQRLEKKQRSGIRRLK